MVFACKWMMRAVKFPPSWVSSEASTRIQSYIDGTFSDEKVANWDERLKTVFNRGFWNGYYLGQRLGEWNEL